MQVRAVCTVNPSKLRNCALIVGLANYLKIERAD